MSQEEGVGKKFFVPRLSPLAPPNPEVRSGRAPVAPAEVNRPSSHPLSEPPRDSWEDMTPSSVPSAPLDPEERRSLIEEIKSLEHRLEEEAVQRRMDQVLSASRAADARLSDEVLQDSVVHTTPHIELDRHPFKGMKDDDVGMAVAELFLKTSDRPEEIKGEPSYDDPQARARFEEMVALAGQVTADERKLIQEIQVLEQTLEEAKSSGDKEGASLLEEEIARQQAALRELRFTDIQI